VAAVRPAASGRPRLLASLLAGLGLQLLVVTPVALVQAIVLLDAPLVFPLGATVLLGGRSSVEIYEATVDEVHGDRRDTFVDAAGWFYVIAGAQALAVAAVLAWRQRKGRGRRDPAALGLLLLVLVNAALAIHWPWWGT
jgi:hypothetical protein